MCNLSEAYVKGVGKRPLEACLLLSGIGSACPGLQFSLIRVTCLLSAVWVLGDLFAPMTQKGYSLKSPLA